MLHDHGFTKPIEHSNFSTKEGDFMSTLYVGIDVSSKSNVVYLMLPDGSKHSKEYRNFYNLKYKEVNRFQHKRALALTARKFVRLVFALLKDNRLYRSAE